MEHGTDVQLGEELVSGHGWDSRTGRFPGLEPIVSWCRSIQIRVDDRVTGGDQAGQAGQAEGVDTKWLNELRWGRKSLPPHAEQAE